MVDRNKILPILLVLALYHYLDDLGEMCKVLFIRFIFWRFFVCLFFSRQYGIPDNQRILDPRKGPIKKTAAVKKLPKLKTSNSADSILPEKSKSGKKKGERKVRSSGNSLAEGIKDVNNNLHT